MGAVTVKRLQPSFDTQVGKGTPVPEGVVHVTSSFFSMA
jgi:hypothetical protein